MQLKPVRTEKDYEAALARIEEIFDAEPDSPAGDELEILGNRSPRSPQFGMI